MPRLFQIALWTVCAFLGGVLTYLGIHFWLGAHRTVLTALEVASHSSSGDLRFDNFDPWIDKDFVLHRIFAATVLLFGVGIFSWAATQILRKPDVP
jgi:hypothetical protein